MSVCSIVNRRHRTSFMLRRQINPDQLFADPVLHLFPFQKIVDLIVSDAESVFVGLAGVVASQIGGWRLGDQAFVCAECAGELANLALVKSVQWREIDGTISELGE